MLIAGMWKGENAPEKSTHCLQLHLVPIKGTVSDESLVDQAADLTAAAIVHARSAASCGGAKDACTFIPNASYMPGFKKVFAV